jgi:hypothetical protein
MTFSFALLWAQNMTFSKEIAEIVATLPTWQHDHHHLRSHSRHRHVSWLMDFEYSAPHFWDSLLGLLHLNWVKLFAMDSEMCTERGEPIFFLKLYPQCDCNGPMQVARPVPYTFIFKFI